MNKSWTSFVILALLSGLTSAARAQDDVADVSSQRISLGAKQEYFLIGNIDAGKDAKDGKDAKPRPLLLILPGGDGSADFNPFVRRIYKNALPDGFVVAELIAVPSKNPNQIVWPTTNLTDPKQNFTTESFINAVAADVAKRTKIDPDQVIALGWSSSGPALYTAAATKDSAVKKFFIAMSVFKATDLPQPDQMKSKRFYLLHSPDDQVCPFPMAQAAKKKLEALGAPVTLTSYDGGHGWRGDVFGMIRAGMDWLEK